MFARELHFSSQLAVDRFNRGFRIFLRFWVHFYRPGIYTKGDQGRLITNQRYKKAALLAACLTRFRRRSLDDDDTFFLIKFVEHHLNDLALLGRHEFAYVISLDGKFAVFFATIN